jgi:hypothetical protein
MIGCEKGFSKRQKASLMIQCRAKSSEIEREIEAPWKEVSAFDV